MYYAINGLHALAVTDKLSTLTCFFANEWNVQAKSFSTSLEAYIYATRKFLMTEYELNPAVEAYAMSYEELCKYEVVYAVGHKKIDHGPYMRTFVIHPVEQYAGVFTDIATVVNAAEFIGDRPVYIEEVLDPAVAEKMIAKELFSRICPAAAYFTESVPLLRSPTVNTLYNLFSFWEWVRNHFHAPEKLRYLIKEQE